VVLAYLITFSTYGSWLHGEFDGSVDLDHNRPGTPTLKPNPSRVQHEQRLLVTQPVRLTDEMRFAVDRAIDDVCTYREWRLHACNVRTNHVHVVVTARETPERVMMQFKAYSTRHMREAGVVESRVKVWARHGSTRYVTTPRSLDRAIRYVRDAQGNDLPTRLPRGWLDDGE
jgi:REP element-mobilizing transposase RayT